MRLPTGPNAHVFQNNGKDLIGLPGAGHSISRFRRIVFQHIPSQEVISNYVREVHRLLRPGALFKFQVQGDTSFETQPDDTWLGVPFSDEDAVAMAGNAASSRDTGTAPENSTSGSGSLSNPRIDSGSTERGAPPLLSRRWGLLQNFFFRRRTDGCGFSNWAMSSSISCFRTYSC